MDAIKNVKTIKYYPTHARTELSHLDKEILNVVDDIATHCHIAIPNLKAMAENPEGAQLYTADTCQEFHLLLYSLLLSFRKSLQLLGQFSKSEPREILQDRLATAAFLGEVLWMVVNSSGIDTYLQAISDDLEIKYVFRKDKDIVVEKEKEDTEKEDTEKEDVDLRGVQPNTVIVDGSTRKSLSAWEACRDWLRLLVVHFEALMVLRTDIISYEKPTTITIKVMAVPPVEEGSTMLTWRRLLNKYYNDTKPALADIIATIEDLQTDKEYEAPRPDPLHPLPDPVPSAVFKAQLGANSPLSRGSGFTGTDHCETCLASFMSKLGSIPSQFQDDFNSILKELSVSHIVSLQFSHPLMFYSDLRSYSWSIQTVLPSVRRIALHVT